MSYDNLDAVDREICQALENGVSDDEIKSQFGVDDDKIAQLKPVVEGKTETPAEEVTPEETPVENTEEETVETAPEETTDAPEVASEEVSEANAEEPKTE